MSRSRFATHVYMYRDRINDYKLLTIIDIFIDQIGCAAVIYSTRAKSQLKIFNQSLPRWKKKFKKMYTNQV